MRKWFLLTCCVGLLMPTLSFAADQKENKSATQSSSTKKLEAVHPYKYRSNITDQFAHWSLSFEGGISLIDGDFPQSVDLIPTSRIRPAGALSLTYDFTPVWGLSLQYGYAPYGVKQNTTNDWLLNGQMHTAELFLNFDLVDAWFPKRKTDIFSFYLVGGLGLGIYTADYYGDPVALAAEKSNDYTTTAVVSLGAAAEFNVSKSIGLGLKGMYHIYTSDNLDSRIKGANNDCMEYASLYLRWKIAGSKKNHPRNYADSETVQNLIDLQKAPKLAAHKATKDTLYIHSKDTIVVMSPSKSAQAPVHPTAGGIQTVVATAQSYYVYFGLNSDRLTESGLQTIQQVADQLAANPELCLEVAGFCDNTGPAQYNKVLGQKRADRVVRELTRVYNIAETRLATVNGGQIDNVKSAYGPNRRVELRLRSQEQIKNIRKESAKAAPKATVKEAPKAAKKEAPKAAPAPVKEAPKAAPAPAPKKEAPKAAPAKQEVKAPAAAPKKEAPKAAPAPAPKKEEAKPAPAPAKEAPKAAPAPAKKESSREVLATVKANQYTTFARLARQYYNNVYCWPYIYAENRDVVINDIPDKITLGATIRVPKLTPKEIREATERKCLEMVEQIQAQPK